MYLAGIELMLLSWRPKSPPGGILLCLAVMGAMLTGAYYSAGFELAVLRYPLWITSGGVLLSLAVWLHMGRHSSSWRLIGQGLYIGNSDRRRELYRTFERRLAARARAMAVAESFFLGRMKGRPEYSGRRYMWGTLYAAFGMWVVGWRWLICVLVAVTIIAGFLGPTAIVIFIAIAWMAD